MSNYEDAFETLATRGTPLGATALLERVEQELVDVGHLVELPRRRLPGLAVAAVVFAAVLAFGAVWALLTRQGEEITSQIDEFGTEWIELADVDGRPEAVTAGPGGFVYAPVGAARGPLEFSTDGREWSPVELPGLGTRSFVRSAGASSDVWMVMMDGGDGVTTWVSSDGLTWEAVVWPESLDGTVSSVVASGGGFLAISRDAFGAGTTLWWSADGSDWVQIEADMPGNIDRASLWGTAAGIAWTSPEDAAATSLPIYHSVDGTAWVEGRIDLPPEFSASPTRWTLSSVDYVGDQWIALGEIERTAAEPVIHVWTSEDAVEWTARGIPEFGLVNDRAVSLSSRPAVIGDVFVVAPAIVPIVEGDDGIVRSEGFVASSGELWATDDGAEWTRVLKTRDEVAAFAGTITGDGRAIGVWMRRLRPNEEEPVEVTMAISVPPQELDQTGLDLQDEILADGNVTEDEFRRAFEGWKECMEERGVTDVSFEINQQGGYSKVHASPDELPGEVEDAACSASYIDRVELALLR